MTDKFDRLREVKATLRAYAGHEDGPTQDDHDEAEGLALAAHHLAAEHDEDPEAFHELIDALHGEDDERHYAAAGKVLAPSRKNPKVRRWIRQNAGRHLGLGAAHVAKAVGLSGAVGTLSGPVGAAPAGIAVGLALGALHRAATRQTTLHGIGESGLNHRHYLKHHRDFVEAQAARHGVGKGAVAHALAYHAHVEHVRQNQDARHGGRMGNGKPHPVVNREITDAQYHKNLAGRAKSSFIKGMVARHGA